MINLAWSLYLCFIIQKNTSIEHSLLETINPLNKTVHAIIRDIMETNLVTVGLHTVSKHTVAHTMARVRSP